VIAVRRTTQVLISVFGLAVVGIALAHIALGGWARLLAVFAVGPPTRSTPRY
jgi:hypothetical protein